MPRTAEAVISLVSKEFNGADVRAAYEAGYSGFWLYRKLVTAGMSCLVVHPASIEVSSRDTVKTDKRDSLKIAQQLAAGRLRGVRVPTEEEEQRRLLTRTRDQLMNRKRRVMVQIRMRKAIVAVARKLAGRIRAALRKHEHYTLDYRAAA